MSRRKDNVDLICSIGELAGLFEKSTSLSDFLQTAVSVVAWHMKSAVCSVYLHEEETGTLLLRANQGLSPDAIGKLRLKVGEGLVGTALKELRPIREGRASRNTHFKLIPGINEERYEAFLAVPILRGLTRVGVLVVQDPVPDYFSENDQRALMAIAAQLASVIENANLLISLHRAAPAKASEAPPAGQEGELKFVHGLAASGGFAMGIAAAFGAREEEFADEEPEDCIATAADFRRALADTEHQLEDLQSDMERRLVNVASMIFSAHLLMVKDPNFSGEMGSLIEQGVSPCRAVIDVVRKYVALFSRSPNPRLREKIQDVKDLGRRLLKNLRSQNAGAADYGGRIVIAEELLPSDILKLAAQRVEGIVQVGGGMTSHITILARALQIPMVIASDGRLLGATGRTLLLDGDQGTVHVDPQTALVARYRELGKSRMEAEQFAANAPETALTRDGERVRVLANINLISEVPVARRMKAEGIGLYRSEFPFIVRSDFPSEDEQFLTYRRLIEQMEGREVVFRTLDIGGDKMLSYFPSGAEANPFLGLRALRFALRYKDVFSTQLRAVLRAGAGGPLSIMFPLVSSVEDFLEAQSLVRTCIVQLGVANVPHNSAPRLGAMIELPSAVGVVEELAAEADFLSIGSNDLVQYMLAVDRTNEQIADLYLHHHPAVLRALNRIVKAALAAKKDVSLCGAMGGDPNLIGFLIGIGLRRISVEVRQIPEIHRSIAATHAGQARALAERVLRLGRLAEIAAELGISTPPRPA